MSIEKYKIKNFNLIKEALYDLYPNAGKITMEFEGDKITVKPTEKYEIKPEDLEE
ncbi:hypothetical protein D1872_288050 [compost metagenome]